MQPAARTSLRDTLLKNDLTTLLLRLSVLYALWMACRVLFYVFNAALIGPILPAEAPRLLRGALLFDSISILYVNIAFVAVSLLPVPGRGNPLFQVVMRRIFVVTNAAALMINLADVFYYPYKLARITSDEALFLQEANRGVLLLRFFRDYWYGWLAFALCAAFLYIAYRRIRYRPFTIRDPRVSYPVQSLVFIVVIAATIVVIRGGTVTRSTIPITISDAGLFTRKPPQTALILSNPFCVIRSRSKRNLACPRYFPADDADSLFTPQHTPAAQYPARLPARRDQRRHPASRKLRYSARQRVVRPVRSGAGELHALFRLADGRGILFHQRVQERDPLHGRASGNLGLHPFV